jgi:amidase
MLSLLARFLPRVFSPTHTALIVCVSLLAFPTPSLHAAGKTKFVVEETTIAEIQSAILAKKLTSTQLVELYLARIQAYNGPAVEEPDGILGVIKPVARAKGINALITLNLRPAARKEWGFDDRKARSMTDPLDNDPAMPDALEVAAQLDAHFAKTGKLIGPLHGVVLSIKDQYDTFDLRTTGGADAFYANDRPPRDATFIKRLREAGAIILAKANLGEYATPRGRSAFGGTTGNPYATDRYPGGSSGGSGASVAANLVTVSIAEETGASIRTPARVNNSVGIAPTQELVSRDGMIGAGLNTRVGPVTRTVEDSARILDVIAGYDPLDELTVFSIGRLPPKPYASYAKEKSLKGLRIGVVREYMDKSLFTVADHESIDITERAIAELKKLGAEIVDPGAGGELFKEAMRAYDPALDNVLYTKFFPEQFPVDASGKPAGDHIATLVEYTVNPSLVPPGATIRDFGGASPTEGESRYWMSRYLKQRGDANIKTLTDLIVKANHFVDPGFGSKKAELEAADRARVLDTRNRLQRRFVIQQVVLKGMADMKLDALVYPTANIPPPILGAPIEPNVNGRPGNSSWNLLGQNGFPAITVPAGFTTQVYNRVKDSASKDGTRLEGPFPAKLPVGVDFLARPFAEPLLFQIASAYERATKHRTPPPDFGPIPSKP